MKTLQHLLRCDGRTARLRYLRNITLLLAGKYLLDRVILGIATGDPWPHERELIDPLTLVLNTTNSATDRGIAITTVLFFIGLVWNSVHRARDAGWGILIGLLTAVPVAHLFVFTALVIAPTQRHTEVLDLLQRSRILDRIMPHSKKGSAAAAVFITLLMAIPLGWFSVRVLEDYGWGLFLGLPFVMGVISAWCYNYREAQGVGRSIGVAILSVLITLVLIFFMAMEGILCIAMAAPIAIVMALFGGIAGEALSRTSNGQRPALASFILLVPLLMAAGQIERADVPLLSVVTSVTVKAPPERVWKELIAFSEIAPPEEFLFTHGISYPIKARIEGTGAGSCRFCEFNTGAFVEPITTWDEPHLLAFSVKDQPVPMTELSIYEHINAPHVDGYFHSRKGQFRLEARPDGTTLLEGTTWYTHDIWPVWYWRWWSDAILHKVHRRVLDHIRAQCEG